MGLRLTKNLVFAVLITILPKALWAQSVLSRSFVGEDLSSQVLEADVCYQSRFENVQAQNTRFSFKTVMRFCNFMRVEAQGAEFRTYFYQQSFTDSSLEKAKFFLKKNPYSPSLPSTARFVRSNLDGASFVGDVSGLVFEECSLREVTVNGRPCEEVLEACHSLSGQVISGD